MVKEIVKDANFLNQKSLKATLMDKRIADDLNDTLNFYKESCVGMSASMIGELKRIIIVNLGFINLIMYNPVITRKIKPFETSEGCLSLTGLRKCVRYEEIDVEYEDINFKLSKNTFVGLTAEIIEHECDHLEGIII